MHTKSMERREFARGSTKVSSFAEKCVVSWGFKTRENKGERWREIGEQVPAEKCEGMMKGQSLMSELSTVELK